LRSRRVIFFFQAEDGIRDVGVTGVQTCALPISLDVLPGSKATPTLLLLARFELLVVGARDLVPPPCHRGRARLGVPSYPFRGHRSEERRVGKECRSRWSPYH